MEIVSGIFETHDLYLEIVHWTGSIELFDSPIDPLDNPIDFQRSIDNEKVPNVF